MDYILEKNLLTQDKPNDRYARPVNVRTYTLNDLAEDISRRNAGITKSGALATFSVGTDILLERIVGGDSLDLDVVNIHPSIPGNLEPGEHPKEVVYRATTTRKVAEAAKKISLRHVEAGSPIRVDFVMDRESDTTNQTITAGGIVRIQGHNIRVLDNKEKAGVLEFISVEDPGAVYTVPLNNFIDNNPSELLIIAPSQMVTGEQVQLKITTYYSGSGKKPLLTPHSVTFDQPLTVADSKQDKA